MSPLPRTLLWRTVLMLAMLLVAAQGAWVMLNRMVEREMRARQISHYAISVANVTRSALVASQRERRRNLLAELSEREGIRIYPATERSPDAVRMEPHVIELARSQVRDGLGPDTQVVLDRASPQALWVSLDIEGERYWLVLSRARLDRPYVWRWVGWTSVVLLLSVAGAYLLVRRINRPLRRLTAAATTLGRGEAPAPLPEVGPAEVRTVTRAFNQMTGDLQRLEAERTLMLAGVSHDLRTPLARLRLAVEMMPDEAAKPGMVQDIEDMDAIVRQFLAFVREGTNETPEDTDLNALVRAVCERYGRVGSAIVTNLQPVPAMRLRPTAMQRLLSNLIDNALKYGRPADGTQAPVEVRTGSADGWVFLCVLDRGPGVPADDVARLLQPFARADESRAGASGSGLGLAIVDRIARSHGGQVKLLRRTGGGLEVRVELPLTPGAR
jgi:two-component system osmolarity sensor histidine kinase EnvZ